MRTKYLVLLSLSLLLLALISLLHGTGITAQSPTTSENRLHLPLIFRKFPPEDLPETPDPSAIVRWEAVNIALSASDLLAWDQFPVRATFVHEESNQELILDGYWAGGRAWTIRFAPSLAGTWRWQTESQDPGLDGKSGQVQVVEPTEEQINENANYRGHVQVADNGRYLTYTDLTPFLWLGDTNWNLNSLRAGLEPGSRESPFYTYLADRKAKKFTLIQTQFFEIIDANEGGHAFPNNTADSGDWSVLNPDHFVQLDRRVDAIWSAGLVVAAHPTWFVKKPASKTTLADAKAISRYLLARYGAYNLIWSLSGEYQYGYDNGEYTWQTADWNSLGRFVQAHNPYAHPVTVHPSSQTNWKNFSPGAGDQSSSGEFHRQEWLNINIQQTGHQEQFLQNIPKRLLQDYAKNPPRPAIHVESWYENHDRRGNPPTPAQLRWKLWATFLNGGAGHTYGTVGVWPFYNPDVDDAPPLNWNDTTWYQGISASGSNDIERVSEVLNTLTWWKLEPQRQRVTVDGRTAQFDYEDGKQDPHLAAFPGDGLFLLYIPEGNQGSVLTINDLVSNVHFSGQWINPRDGSKTTAGDVSTNANGELRIPDRQSNEDWLFLLVVNE